jgi:hypothetical protein
MHFDTIMKIAGSDAIRVLHELRSKYATTGRYPFIIGDDDELERLQESAELNEQDPADIIETSHRTSIAEWIVRRRKEREEDGFTCEEFFGEWPSEITEKGSIGLHRDILTGNVKTEVYLGLVMINQPWQLPAILRYGAWNDCPDAAIHCAFHREWQARFGAEITGMSGDVVECIVAHPPSDRDSAMGLAWEQYWYCADIVEQGCESIANLAATLLNSPYWYFWWD